MIAGKNINPPYFLMTISLLTTMEIVGEALATEYLHRSPGINTMFLFLPLTPCCHRRIALQSACELRIVTSLSVGSQKSWESSYHLCTDCSNAMPARPPKKSDRSGQIWICGRIPFLTG